MSVAAPSAYSPSWGAEFGGWWAWLGGRSVCCGGKGVPGVRSRISALAVAQLEDIGRLHWVPRNWRKSADPIGYWTERAGRQANKFVLKVDLGRRELVQAYMNADLFVFASNIEYSPLVLLKPPQAAPPFSQCRWGMRKRLRDGRGGGVICPAPKDERGYTRADPQQFAAEMKRLMDAPEALSELGRVARERWMKQFTWARIAERYESILRGSDAVHRPESTAERSVT